MHDLIRGHFAGLIKALNKTALAEDRQQFIAKSILKLDSLYKEFRETNASRCGDHITLIVQSILKELQTCAGAGALETDFRNGLHQLHEQLGIPMLPLKPPVVPKAARRAKS
jgi:hypothetical protein